MRTPGRCTNIEGCWISASHRNVWLSVGEEFVCPNCGGNLSAPLAETRSFRAVKRAATFGAVGAVAAIGLVVVGLGTVKLATVSWPGRPVAEAVVHVPAAILAAASGSRPAAPSKTIRVADDGAPLKPLTPLGERTVSQIVVSKGPTSPFAMTLADPPGSPNPRTATRNALGKTATKPTLEANMAANAATGPLILYPAPSISPTGAKTTRGTDDAIRADEQHTDSTVSEARSASIASIITMAEAPLSPAESTQAPVLVEITYGKPPGPETDIEPVSTHWSHHSIVSHRHSGFLPAATTTSRPASADAIAQICRIPSLLH